MRTTHVLAVSLAVTALLGVTSCGDDKKADTASDSTQPTTPPATKACDATKGAVVGYSEPLPDPNFKIIEDVITDELAKVGASLKAVNANLDPGKQIGDIKALQQQGIKALIVNPVDPNAVQAVLADVTKASIPVIAEDTEKGGPYFTSIQSDSGTAGSDGAELLKEKAGGGTVVSMVGPPFAEILERSRIGFEAGATSAGLTVADNQTNPTITPDAARGIAEQWKQKYGKDLKGIWTFNDVSAIGVASTFDDSFKPALISINGQPDAIPLIKAGKITATYDLQTDIAGRALAYAAIKALCGEKMPEQVWVGAKLIDSSNVDSFVAPDERAKKAFEVTLEERDGKTYVAGS